MASKRATNDEFNSDHAVDAADYAVWRDGLGDRYTQADYDLWRANFGQPTVFVPPPDPDPPSDVRTWAIEATIIELHDPEGVFSEVRLGDPIRGFIRYDRATPPTLVKDEVTYRHDAPFSVVEMVVENPRDGSQIEFLTDPETGGFVAVINDAHDELLGEFDAINAVHAD